MSAFGKQIEVKSLERKLYTGVENFKVVAINPTKEELEKMYDREINFTPEYVGKITVSDADGEREVDQIRLDFFLANEDNSITTKLQFYVANTHHKSSKGSFKVINSFGKSTWLQKADIESKQTIDRMPWFNIDGVKVARRGEVELINAVINVLNLPMDLNKVEKVEDAYAKISSEQWIKIISGDVSLLRQHVLSTNNKLGVLLGVKTNGDGKMTQTAFNKQTLRQFTLSSKKEGKYQYLAKNVRETQAAGALGNVDFGSEDFVLKQYIVTPSVIDEENSNQTDVFAEAETSEEATNSDKEWFN